MFLVPGGTLFRKAPREVEASITSKDVFWR
jgi:hypothetical protein